MTFLPIVDRELRVAARRRGTYWVRIIVAVAAMLVGGCIFLGDYGKPQQTVGPDIFIGLSMLSLVYCLLAGRYSTADCLSGEKREGTLGLLFLTDLKGYDVVLGKLAATSLNAFYGLLAVFPVLAVPLLMGGVSNGEFWRMALVLANAFLFSLAIGIFVSALSRDAHRAITAYFLLLLFCLIGLPVISGVIAYLTPTHVFVHEFCLTSPVYASVMAFDKVYPTGPRYFWWSAALIHGLTWLLVLVACYVAPRSWQDQPARAGRRSWREILQQWSYGNPTKRKLLRKRLLDGNAFYWLAGRDRLKPRLLWGVFGLLACGWFIAWLRGGYYWFDGMMMVGIGFVLNLTLKLWIAMETGQRLAEERRTGSLELLLSTPLTVRGLVRGQRLALQRQLLGPMIAVILIQLWWIKSLESPYQLNLDNFLTLVTGIMMLIADSVTLFWVALLAALTSRNSNQASVTTLLRVMVLPWALFALVVLAVNVGFILQWKFCLMLWFVLGLGTDLFYGLTAWWQVRRNFRRLAAERPLHAAAPRTQ